MERKFIKRLQRIEDCMKELSKSVDQIRNLPLIEKAIAKKNEVDKLAEQERFNAWSVNMDRVIQEFENEIKGYKQ